MRSDLGVFVEDVRLVGVRVVIDGGRVVRVPRDSLCYASPSTVDLFHPITTTRSAIDWMARSAFDTSPSDSGASVRPS